MRITVKLFGNKRGASHLKRGSDAAAKGARRLTGTQKGIILMAASLLVLGLTVYAVYKDFVKPPEKAEQPVMQTVEEETETTFRPPTVVQVETKVDEATGEEIQVETEVPASHKEGFYNILIVGTDDDGSRTDTIMIARLNTKDHTAAILSIPRDTLIDSSMTVPKINGAYSYVGKGEKGINNLKSHLANLLGFEVDGYALVNLDAFVELVDLVGGVEFDVPMRMYYTDASQDLYIDLQPGKQLLDGEHAMQLVRFRKGYASQDIQRTQVQQQFLRALAKKCLQVVNLAKIGEMADIFAANVTTDLSVGNIAYFGQELLKCDFDQMFTHTLEGEGVTMDGLSYYALYLNSALEVINDQFNPYETDITEANVAILTPAYVRSLQPKEEPEEEEPSQEEETPSEENPEEELPGEAEPPEEEQFPEEQPLLPDDPLVPELPTDSWVEEPTPELPPEGTGL